MTHTTTSPTIRIDKAGGPEEMKLVDLPVGEPGAGEMRIRHHASGLNYIDVYQRSGVYALPMPLTLGNEGAGVIEAVGAGVTHLKPGDRAAYCSGPPGSYALARVMPAKTRRQAARRDLVRDRRGDDAEGPDGAVPAQARALRRRRSSRATSSSGTPRPAASA